MFQSKWIPFVEPNRVCNQRVAGKCFSYCGGNKINRKWLSRFEPHLNGASDVWCIPHILEISNPKDMLGGSSRKCRQSFRLKKTVHLSEKFVNCLRIRGNEMQMKPVARFGPKST